MNQAKNSLPEKNAFFIECSAPFWPKVARKLAKHQGIKPRYWTGLNLYRNELLDAFPQLTYHDCGQAKRNHPPVAFSHHLTASFDSLCQSIWLNEAQTLYDMLNRFDHALDFSFAERSQYFYQALVYWNAIIKALKPDVIIFPNAPHVGYDYVIYCLAKAQNIQTILFEETAVIPYSYSLSHFMEGSAKIKKHDRPSPSKPVSTRSLTYLNKIKQSYNKAQPVREKALTKDLEGEGRIKALKHLLEAFSSIFDYEYRQSQTEITYESSPVNTGSLFKQAGQSLKSSYTGSFAQSHFLLQRIRENILSQKRKDHYLRLTKNPDFEAPYIYCPLAGQPERTSNPQGGVFTNQLLMVNVLANNLPSGWKLLVKEHPNQFHHGMTGHSCRNAAIYEMMNALPNVSLVATHINPFVLIDNAKAIALISGTTGWEALSRGKPVIMFGAGWYQQCRGVLRVNNFDDCKAAVDAIEEGFVPCDEDIQAFVATLESEGFKGLSDPLPDWYGITDEGNARKLYKEICWHLESVALSKSKEYAVYD